MPLPRRLFLYGGHTDAFAATVRPFVAAAGGSRACIALLFATGGPGWDRYLPQYRDALTRAGAADIVPIHPPQSSPVLGEEASANLAQASGIFMCGGDTRLYQQIYVRGAAAALLRGAYARGVPYGGLSAGALLVPARCLVYGDRWTRAANRLHLRGAEDGCDAELRIGEGLGLLPHLMVEAHFSECGGYPRLLAGMELGQVSCGLGIDDAICAIVRNEDELEIAGRGRAYLQRRSGPSAFEAMVLQPGDAVSLAQFRGRAAPGGPAERDP